MGIAAISAGGSSAGDIRCGRARETLTKLTFNAQGNITPCGRGCHHLVFSGFRTSTLFWIRSDGGGEPRKLLVGKLLFSAIFVFADGRRLAYDHYAGFRV